MTTTFLLAYLYAGSALASLIFVTFNLTARDCESTNGLRTAAAVILWPILWPIPILLAIFVTLRPDSASSR